MDSCLSNSYTDVTCDQQFSGDVQSKNTFSGFLSFGGMQWGQRSLQKAANVVLHTFKFSFSQARTYLWSCSCGAMHCLFKADNPNREREGESEGEGEGEVAGRVLGQSEEEREVRANKRQWVQTHSVCDTLWWRVRGWQRWRERGALPDRERERQRERERERERSKKETEEEKQGWEIAALQREWAPCQPAQRVFTPLFLRAGYLPSAWVMEVI